MFGKRKIFGAMALTIGVAVLMGSSVAAQTYWMWPGNENSVSLEMLKPQYAGSPDFGILNAVWFLSGRFEVNENLSIFADLPISYYDWNGNRHLKGEEHSQIGSPYVGIENKLSELDSPYIITGRLGVRPPIATDVGRNSTANAEATAIDRIEAFIPDLWSLTGGFGYSRNIDGGGNYWANFDGVLLMSTLKGVDKELLINYNFGFRLTASNISLGAGFNGRWWATESDLDLGEATRHQLGFKLNYDSGDFSPGLHLRVPLDNGIGNFVDYVYGFNLTFDIDK